MQRAALIGWCIYHAIGNRLSQSISATLFGQIPASSALIPATQELSYIVKLTVSVNLVYPCPPQKGERNPVAAIAKSRPLC